MYQLRSRLTKAKHASKKKLSSGPFQSSHGKNETRSSETHMENNKNAEYEDNRTKSSALEPNKKALNERTASVHPNTPLQIQATPEAFNSTLQSMHWTAGQTATSSVDVALSQDLSSSSSSPGNAQWQISEVWKVLENFYQWYPNMKGHDDEPLETAVENITRELGNMYKEESDKLAHLKRETNQDWFPQTELETKAFELPAHEGTIVKEDQDLRVTQIPVRQYWTRHQEDQSPFNDKEVSLQKQIELESKAVELPAHERTIVKEDQNLAITQNPVHQSSTQNQENRPAFNDERALLKKQIDILKSENAGLRFDKEGFESRLRKTTNEASAKIQSAQERDQREIERLNLLLKEESEYRDRVNSLSHKVETLKNKNLNLENRLFNTELNRDQRIKSLKAEINRLDKTAEEEKKTLHSLLETQKAEITRLNKTAEEERKTLHSLLETQKSEIDWLNKTAEEERETLHSLLETQKAEITWLNKKAEEEKRTLHSRLETQKAILNERHEVETKELRSVAEDLKQAFVAREHFKGLRDRDITGKFTRLATEVEDISTIEWNNSDTGNWPLSERQLLQIHPNNIRMLKQHIVQSSIWLLLYRHVMKSPFRIMGTEGQQVDEAWREIWNSEDSFGWPEISAEMEKSRYEQARMFLTAIEPSTKSSPENRKLKSSHEIAVEKARNELHYALGRVSNLSERDRKILDNMVRLCAKVWLECCSQRYRLLVTLSDELDGLNDLLMSPRRDTRSLRLLVKPNIKRFGTSQGGDITTGEIVTGWKGLVERYPKH